MSRNLSPWDKAFQGARGRSRNEHQPVNFPPNTTFPSNLTRVNVEPLEMIGTCLKAEHSNRIDDSDRNETGQYKHEFNPGYTGIFHFLYRLRLKSNYKDVEIFITEAPESDINDFTSSLYRCCCWSLMLLETILIRKCRKQYLLDLAQKYLDLNSKAEHLKRRVEYYKSNI